MLSKIRMLLDGSQKSCSECTRMYRPDSAVDIRRGMHIAVPGQYESASFKVRKYHHHAVVLAVLPSDDTSVTLEVIHVTGERDEKGNLIRKENKTYQTRDVLIIEHPEISLGDVADKALDDFEHQSGKRKQEYNVLTNNCEHFVHSWLNWKKKSHQISDWKQLFTGLGIMGILWSIYNRDRLLPGCELLGSH